MKLILIAVFILSITETNNVKAFCAKLSTLFQQRCLKLTNSSSKFKPELQSIVCGQSIQFSQHITEIKRLGLIHIFVVSGAHFATLQFFLSAIFTGIHKIFPIRSRHFRLWFEHFFLGIFLFATGLQAPALRSLLQSLCRGLFPWIPSPLLILAVGLFCFALIPPTQQLSLQLSWYCALILAWPGLRGAWGFFVKSLFLFLGCSYFLSALGATSLMGVLSNLLLAPVISFGLFPLGLLSLAIPSSVGLFEKTMQLFYWISSEISPDFYFQTMNGSLNLVRHWIFIACLHFLLHLHHVHKLRNAHG